MIMNFQKIPVQLAGDYATKVARFVKNRYHNRSGVTDDPESELEIPVGMTPRNALQSIFFLEHTQVDTDNNKYLLPQVC